MEELQAAITLRSRCDPPPLPALGEGTEQRLKDQQPGTAPIKDTKRVQGRKQTNFRGGEEGAAERAGTDVGSTITSSCPRVCVCV